MPPRRCFPMGSSKADFHGIFQRRRCAQRRRSLLSFSPPPPGRTSFFTIRPDNDAARAHSRSRKPAGSPYPFPHFPRAPESCFFLYPAARPTIPRAVAETMLAEGLVRGGFLRAFLTAALCAAPPFPFVLLSPATGCRASVPAHANRRAVPTLFHIFPARPSHASSFTLPPAIGCRVRTPRRCFPLGSSKAAFCGLLQGRRDDACRWARPRRPSTGFCRVAEAMLPVGLV